MDSIYFDTVQGTYLGTLEMLEINSSNHYEGSGGEGGAVDNGRIFWALEFLMTPINSFI